MRHLFRKNVSDQQLEYHLKSGNYAGLMLAYEGTNDTGNTATRDHIGSVLFNRQGFPVVNCDAELLSYLNDLKGGYATFASSIAGAFSAFIFIPFGDFGDRNNSYLITKDEDVYVKLDFTALAAQLASGTVTVYGIMRDGVQNYQYNIHMRNVIAQGAGWISDNQELDNVATILLKDFSNVDDIQIMKDEELVFNLNTTAALALSNWNNQVEASVDLIELDLNTSRDAVEILSKEIQFRYNFGAADTLGQYFTYKTFTPKKAVQSKVANTNKGQSKVVRQITKQLPILIPVGFTSSVPPVSTE